MLTKKRRREILAHARAVKAAKRAVQTKPTALSLSIDRPDARYLYTRLDGDDHPAAAKIRSQIIDQVLTP